MEVVAHQEDVVHDVRHLHRLDLIQIPAAGRAGNGEGVVLSVPAALPVKPGPQLPEELCEILSVLRPVDVSRRSAGHRILPVQVHPVQTVLRDEVHAAVGEPLPSDSRGRGVRKVFGIRPAAYGDDELQVGVLLPELPQGGEVLFVAGRVLQVEGQCLRVDPGEGVVDPGQVLRRDLVRSMALVRRPAGIVAHRLAGGCTPCSVCIRRLCPGAGGGAEAKAQAQSGQPGGADPSDVPHVEWSPFLSFGRLPARFSPPLYRTGP